MTNSDNLSLLRVKSCSASTVDYKQDFSIILVLLHPQLYILRIEAQLTLYWYLGTSRELAGLLSVKYRVGDEVKLK